MKKEKNLQIELMIFFGNLILYYNINEILTVFYITDSNNSRNTSFIVTLFFDTAGTNEFKNKYLICIT